MKILLVQPAPFEPGRLGLENVVWLSEPVALTALAAMVPEHETRILDLRLEPDTALNETLLAFRPDLVGVTSMTTDCYQAKAVLEVAKGTLGDGCLTVVGGHHPTLCPEDFEDDCVDAICLGEGEDTIRELLAHLAGGHDARALHAIDGLRFRDDIDHGLWLEQALARYATTPEAQAQVQRGALLSLEARARFWTGVQEKIVRWRQPQNVHLRSQSYRARKADRAWTLGAFRAHLATEAAA